MSENWGDAATVKSNKSVFLEKWGLKPEGGVMMAVGETDRVVVVGKSEAGKMMETDALVTVDRGAILMLLTADCLPIVFYEPAKKVLALAHCGWKSTGAKLVQKVVGKIVEIGGVTSELRVMIGPSVRKESYKFEKVIQIDDWEWRPFLKQEAGGQFSIDLVGMVSHQLSQVGVKRENIEVSPVDTIADKNYFSHYRAMRTGELEGRFMTAVGMRP